MVRDEFSTTATTHSAVRRQPLTVTRPERSLNAVEPCGSPPPFQPCLASTTLPFVDCLMADGLATGGRSAVPERAAPVSR